VCIPAAIGAIRAATIIRGAAAARTLAAAASRTRAFKVTGARIRVAVRQSRTVAKRSKAWVRRNWRDLHPAAQACLRGGAIAGFGQYADGDVVTQSEWSAFINFTYPGLPPLREVYFNPAFDFSKTKSVVQAGCLTGMAAYRWPGPSR
jgi:hypothetical protein